MNRFQSVVKMLTDYNHIYTRIVKEIRTHENEIILNLHGHKGD